jgi:hypothetical protein
MILRFAHAALNHPASSIRCAAGNSEPGFTWNVPLMTCAILREIAVHWFQSKDLQDQDIERTLQESSS